MSEPAFNPRANVEVEAIFAFDAQRGLVVLRVADGSGNVMETQHTAAKAREMAQMLLEAAGAADADEAVIMVLKEADFALNEIGIFLGQLRSARALIDRRGREEARRYIAQDQYNVEPDAPEA